VKYEKAEGGDVLDDTEIELEQFEQEEIIT
jgi:hypothetical protein